MTTEELTERLWAVVSELSDMADWQLPWRVPPLRERCQELIKENDKMAKEYGETRDV